MLLWQLLWYQRFLKVTTKQKQHSFFVPFFCISGMIFSVFYETICWHCFFAAGFLSKVFGTLKSLQKTLLSFPLIIYCISLLLLEDVSFLLRLSCFEIPYTIIYVTTCIKANTTAKNKVGEFVQSITQVLIFIFTALKKKIDGRTHDKSNWIHHSH